jgi:hypothetical protein
MNAPANTMKARFTGAIWSTVRRSVRKLQCQSALGLVITQWSDRLGLAPPLTRSPRGYADRDACQRERREQDERRLPLRGTVRVVAGRDEGDGYEDHEQQRPPPPDDQAGDEPDQKAPGEPDDDWRHAYRVTPTRAFNSGPYAPMHER